MANEVVISVENLSKRYRIGARQEQVHTLRERIENLVSSPFGYLGSTVRGPSGEEIVLADKGLPRVKSRLNVIPFRLLILSE